MRLGMPYTSRTSSADERRAGPIDLKRLAAFDLGHDVTWMQIHVADLVRGPSWPPTRMRVLEGCTDLDRHVAILKPDGDAAAFEYLQRSIWALRETARNYPTKRSEEANGTYLQNAAELVALDLSRLLERASVLRFWSELGTALASFDSYIHTFSIAQPLPEGMWQARDAMLANFLIAVSVPTENTGLIAREFDHFPAIASLMRLASQLNNKSLGKVLQEALGSSEFCTIESRDNAGWVPPASIPDPDNYSSQLVRELIRSIREHLARVTATVEPGQSSHHARSQEVATEARDKWIYDQCCSTRPQRTYRQIIAELKRKPGCRVISTPQGIRHCAASYAKRHRLPPPPPRQEK